jgi:hypothetical protein
MTWDLADWPRWSKQLHYFSGEKCIFYYETDFFSFDREEQLYNTAPSRAKFQIGGGRKIEGKVCLAVAERLAIAELTCPWLPFKQRSKAMRDIIKLVVKPPVLPLWVCEAKQ